MVYRNAIENTEAAIAVSFEESTSGGYFDLSLPPVVPRIEPDDFSKDFGQTAVMALTWFISTGMKFDQSCETGELVGLVT